MAQIQHPQPLTNPTANRPAKGPQPTGLRSPIIFFPDDAVGRETMSDDVIPNIYGEFEKKTDRTNLCRRLPFRD
jgi:hypothetical protein